MMKQDTKQTMSMRKAVLIGAVAVLALAFFATVVQAASTIVVTPTDQAGWSTADTRPGGAVTFVVDGDAPLGDGALNLTTNASTTAKAQYLHAATTSLSDVTTLSYYAKNISGPAIAAPAYQLLVDLNGTSTTGGFTTFVYEPYQNGTVTPGVWQQWDVDAGQLWSSRTFSEGTCTVVAGGGGAPFYTLAGLQATCPLAVAIGFGVNIGSNNPSYNVNTDAVVFNDTTYDFEVTAPDTVAPALPTHVSPANNATTTTADLTEVDWTDVTDDSSPVTYYYESSLSSTTNVDGSFTVPAYVSGPLASSEIPASGTPEGTYYWHVRAVDSEGNSSAWTSAWSFTVDNTPEPPPATGPANKDACKKGGWMTFTNPSFKNQGQCVSSTNK